MEYIASFKHALLPYHDNAWVAMSLTSSSSAFSLFVGINHLSFTPQICSLMFAMPSFALSSSFLIFSTLLVGYLNADRTHRGPHRGPHSSILKRVRHLRTAGQGHIMTNDALEMISSSSSSSNTVQGSVLLPHYRTLEVRPGRIS